MLKVSSSFFRALTVLFVTGMGIATASDEQTPNQAIESRTDTTSHVCPANEPNHCKAREVFNNGVVMQKANNSELASWYFEVVKDLIDDPNDALYKKADSRLQALSNPDKPIESQADSATHVCPANAPTQCQAREVFNNAVVMQKANNAELASLYFEEVKTLVDDPNDPLYQKADERLKKLVSN